ncbi:hypothetical protein [Erythrobacter sp.]|uniref:hypothetical protein n=1 Tax=Erythrobacter sp. TaxID=1042 RepID=UPI001425C6D4|nr:hypothetical protein [Erythrobacter sp.]QIQ85250.1 MAG: hypothetical protein G9473_00070 [Erythrobacter sp.]QIQ88001.1 MAG: hypothetical protein G9473_15835 [Erythrobacter sp.]
MARDDASEPAARLIFVYNADSGVWPWIEGMAQKLFAPERYPCSLCLLTYGRLMMYSDWRRFVFRLPLEKVFLHRDEAARKGLSAEWPAVLLDTGRGEPIVLVSAAELNAMQHRQALMALLLERLKETGVLAR